MNLPEALAARVEAWLADDPSEQDAAELRVLLEAGDEAALADRFSAELTFGTAGLRGPLRAGPNGMNSRVVRQAAAGIAAQLIGSGQAGGIVVIGYDGRHRSREFAYDSARILSAAGLRAQLLPRMLPTPVLAFAVRHQAAAAGIMVTASHNPPQDNGYKVYAADGAQIVPPLDAEIEARIRAVTSVRQVRLAEDFEVLDEGIVNAYVQAVARLVAPESPRRLQVVHTAMHGVGASIVRAAFAQAGFPAPVEVAAQAEPDPDFPTVAFPNPEEPGAMDLALAQAESSGADLIIANDPDADRCAIGARFADGWRMLRGDEVGVLLADWLIRKGVRGTYATTIVSSSMLGVLAARHRLPYRETLTGFKWISRAADDLVYGYEEALGYAVAPGLVRDKDGISAALVMAELAATLLAEGRDLPARLAELAAEYGLFATRQQSWRVSDLSLIAQAMSRLRAHPPATLLGRPVSVTDLAANAQRAADVVILRFDGGRVVVRPSGTEPKCKAYLEVVIAQAGDLAAAESAADAQLAELGTQISQLLAF
ncbi:MAG TPA: phospho-sugar mutase [Jatrophihabitans sp.]|nr:phospho-sugar mutase [Jatrophihabitans sp.]